MPKEQLVPPSEIRTSLDPLFRLGDRTLFHLRETANEIINPPLEVIAARLNASPFVTIGPHNDSALSQHEMTRMDDAMMNRTFPLVRIFVGDPEFDAKQDYYHAEQPSSVELKFAEVLTIIGQYDRTMALALIDPLAKELLVERERFTNKDTLEMSVATNMRIPARVQESVDRLRLFGRKNDPDTSEFYTTLADKTEEVATLYQHERDEVIEQTAAQKATEHKRKTRGARYLLRGVGATILAASGASFLLVGSEPISPDIATEGRTAARIVRSLGQTEYDLTLLDSPAATKADRDAIERLRQLSIAKHRAELAAMKPANPLTPNEHVVDDNVERVKEQAFAAISDGAITVPESVDMTSDAAALESLVIAEARENKAERWFWGTLFGLVGSFVSLASSVHGGKFDNRLKQYKKGQLLPQDLTSSPAVDSERGNLRVVL